MRATLLAHGKLETWNTPRRVTTDVRDLDRVRHPVVARCLSETGITRAITFTSTHNRHEFDIWINPDVVEPENPNFSATVLHELCHGYLGTEKEHNKTWRRLYARVLFHYDHAISPIDHHPALVDLANWRYTKRSKTETTSQFLKRINADRDTWLRQAEDEMERVEATWKRMNSQS